MGTAATDAVGGKPSRSDAKSPDERIDEATSKLGESLSDELLQMVMDKEPAFFGALGSIHDGVFITTSSFIKEAIDAAERYLHATVVLIDGKRFLSPYDE